MDVFEPMLANIKTDFVERKLKAKVVDSNFYEEIFIFIGKDFLDMFGAWDGVIVAGELLSPCWGKYLDDNLDGLPYWMAQVKYKTVNKDRLTECLEQMDKVMAYQRGESGIKKSVKNVRRGESQRHKSGEKRRP